MPSFVVHARGRRYLGARLPKMTRRELWTEFNTHSLRMKVVKAKVAQKLISLRKGVTFQGVDGGFVRKV